MYSPVKNSAADARKAAEAGAPTHSATTGEFDVYRAHATALQRAGCAVEARGEQCFNGLTVDASAQIVLMPSFAVTSAQLRVRSFVRRKCIAVAARAMRRSQRAQCMPSKPWPMPGRY